MLNFFQIKYFDADTHGAFDSGSVYFISECHSIIRKEAYPKYHVEGLNMCHFWF